MILTFKSKRTGLLLKVLFDVPTQLRSLFYSFLTKKKFSYRHDIIKLCYVNNYLYIILCYFYRQYRPVSIYKLIFKINKTNRFWNVRSKARHAILLQFISANILKIIVVQIPKCTVRCGVACTEMQIKNFVADLQVAMECKTYRSNRSNWSPVPYEKAG
jgi:hypothetical protein